MHKLDWQAPKGALPVLFDANETDLHGVTLRFYVLFGMIQLG